jgi:ubiquinone/menaquinone biosynthesis C-methylase UbiE
MAIGSTDLKMKHLKDFYETSAQLYEKSTYFKAIGKISQDSLKVILQRIFVRYLLRNLKCTNLLDVGCYEAIHRRDFCGEYVGIDIATPPLVRVSNDRREDVGLHLILADAQNLPFKGDSFESILCCQVLEHLPRFYQALSEMCRTLKKKGVVIITVPNFNFSLRRGRPILHYYHPLKCWYLHTAFKPDELKGLAERVGLKVLISGTIAKEEVLIHEFLILARLLLKLLKILKLIQEETREATLNKLMLQCYKVFKNVVVKLPWYARTEGSISIVVCKK